MNNRAVSCIGAGCIFADAKTSGRAEVIIEE